MSQELNLIEQQRLDNLNNNNNRKRTEKQMMNDRKKQYLKEYNSKKNGQLNEQDWVGPEMDLFHQKMTKKTKC